MNYQTFIAQKRIVVQSKGITVSDSDIHPMLFPFQRDMVRWACSKGQAAIFADTGLGKTMMQLEWARLMGQRTLIVAPLSVARQTVREAQKIDLEVVYVRGQEQVTDGAIYITNYEMIDKFDFSQYGSIVLDESSILKAIGGKTRKRLTALCKDIPYRLCCTATPAPNDYTELGNHVEFLGICKASEMLAMFFINANKEHTFVYGGKSYHRKGSNKGGQEWRLKHHAEEPFFRWLSSWAMALIKPSDLGYSDEGFILPPLTINPLFVQADYVPRDQLFFTHIKGIKHASAIRRQTAPKRLEVLRELIDASPPDEQWIIWCGLNIESKLVADAFPEAIEVKGNQSAEFKAKAFEDFQDGKYRLLVTKGKIGGYGLNLQNAHKMIFFGLSFSWELFYQCVRREWRYMQPSPVDVYIVMSDIESSIYSNIMRKDAMAKRLREKLIAQVRVYEKGELTMTTTQRSEYEQDTISGDGWTAMLGDSCVRLKEIEDESISMSVYSPPFADLFVYTDSERDLGNNRGWDEFFDHYAFIIREMLRVTKPGRLTCVHTSDIPAMLQKDGYIGVKDFPGAVIKAYCKEGWIFVGRAFVDKNPQALRNGTKVLSPDGWIPIEKLSVGIEVIGVDGQPTKVTGVYPQGKRQMYRVFFSDKTDIDCHGDHLWSVGTYGGYKWHTKRTSELYQDGLSRPSGSPKYKIPICAPVEFSGWRSLPIDPYLLGVLLGDGCISQERTVEICTDTEIVDRLVLPDKHHIVRRPGGDRQNGKVGTFAIVCDDWHRNDILTGLRSLGLQGKRAWEKSIPMQYLIARDDDRRLLLQGLLDTDGTVKKYGAVKLATTSTDLAYDVKSLVESLGGLALIRKTTGSQYKYRGETRQGRAIYDVSIQLPGDWCPFRLSHKVDRWHPRIRGFQRNIREIVKIDTDHCTCISVEAEDGLFVTEHCIVTHNSQAIRVKSKALLFVQLRKDSACSRPALIDQILLFRKPGDNAIPITPVDNGELDNETWIEWAHGIWTGIRETETLQYYHARDSGDEKHVCPLQLETIERCVKLWSNPGETVLTPFGGIGSEAYVAVELGRKAILIELKRSYFDVAVKNLKKIEVESRTEDLFSLAGIVV